MTNTNDITIKRLKEQNEQLKEQVNRYIMKLDHYIDIKWDLQEENKNLNLTIEDMNERINELIHKNEKLDQELHLTKDEVEVLLANKK